jgi:hypothetical protein
MRFTKKMIMVPEAEYQTLLNMIKGDNYLKTEKAETETKMSNILRDPKLSEGTKARKYDLLFKKRRQLKNEIEKPPKIQIDPEQLKNIQDNISKYLGIGTATPHIAPSTPQAQPSSQKKKRNRKPPQSTPSPQKPIFTTPTPPEAEDESADAETSGTQALSYIIHPYNYDHLIKIIKQNDQKLGVNKKSKQITDALGNPILNSNYIKVVDYLTGNMNDKPPGTDVLIKRMENEKYYKEAIKYANDLKQRGEGKRRRKKNTTKGMIRIKKPVFKPTIWERI